MTPRWKDVLAGIFVGIILGAMLGRVASFPEMFRWRLRLARLAYIEEKHWQTFHPECLEIINEFAQIGRLAEEGDEENR